MTATGEPTPRAYGTVRAIDQFVALCVVSHPRCGWYRGSLSSHNQIASSSEATNAVRLVWDLVVDTRREFAIGPLIFSRRIYWLIKFEMSPLVLGIFGDPVITFDDWVARNWKYAYASEWVDSRRWLLPPFTLHDLVTGEEESLYPRALPPQPSTSNPVQSVNHVWFVASGFESDLEGGNMLGMSIGRLADRDPGATSVVIRLGYPAASHKVGAVLFSKSVANEAVAVVMDRKSPEKCVFVVIDIERSFSSQSLCVLSETSIELDTGCYILGYTVILMYQAGCRCFIAEAYLVPFMKCVQISENNCNVTVLTTDIWKVSQLSTNLFAVILYNKKETSYQCDIWDCNKPARPILRLPLPSCNISDPKTEAELLFYMEDNDLRVMEPLTGFTVLRVTLPAVGGTYSLSNPFCFPRHSS